jgi:peptide-methionine (S)-S-oxide reductase
MFGSKVLKVLPAFVLLAGMACASSVKVAPPAVDEPQAQSGSQESVVLSGGCFWGVQAVFQRINGVISATSGYAGGSASTAQYETVSTGETGHAESVKIVFDPSRITFGQLLQVFFSVVHDPTELNRQGPDEGTQYRSAIFYTTDQQKKVAEAYIAQLDQAKAFHGRIVTQVNQLKGFYPAEGYHQNYYSNHPESLYIQYNDKPKVAALKKEFPQLYVEK